jgi:hypothetical protein
MVDEPLHLVLEATGYLSDGTAAPGTYLGGEAVAVERRRGRTLVPDAMWRGPTALSVYFKFEPQPPSDELVGTWRREIWNEGFAPLLWVVSPARIDLYNGFGRPLREDQDAAAHHLRQFQNIETQHRELDDFAGRFAMETGQFWLNAPAVNRKTSVDQQLLADLAYLESALLSGGLSEPETHALIGRAIFVKYLIDRRIVRPDRLSELTGHDEFSPILRNREATAKLFAWLVDIFNGNMFPPAATDPPSGKHLTRVADFLDATDSKGQRSLFPYQFDVIPVELISSIYEQFAQGRPGRTSTKRPNPEAVYRSVHHTPLPVVSLVLDEIMEGLTGNETVLDLACGSAVFLVEALRRLVHRAAGGIAPSRSLIRRVLYEQVYGIDVSEAAIGVAAFSLYLAALELDPDPHPAEALKFEPLIGRTLHIGDAHVVEIASSAPSAEHAGEPAIRKQFDLIVGNPPWSFRGKAGTEERRRRSRTGPLQPRGEGLDFAWRALDYAHSATRFGFVLCALPFFSASHKGWVAAKALLEKLAPATLVNLSNLRTWLFPAAKMPAVVLLARHRHQPEGRITIVQVPWSEAGARSHTFEISPCDIKSVSVAELNEPQRLKAAAVGHRRDLMLLEQLTLQFRPLEAELASLETGLRTGVIRGTERDAGHLRELPLLKDGLTSFRIPPNLPLVDFDRAERPRPRDNFRAPLLVVQEFVEEPGRAVAAVAGDDMVYTNAFYGASFGRHSENAARLVAGIVSSAVASWFMTMTASEFALGKRRLLRRDIARLPVPRLTGSVGSIAAVRVLAAQRSFPRAASRPSLFDQAASARPIAAFQAGEETIRSMAEAWSELDEAVFDLYDLDAADRVVVRDGLVRAGWEWQSGLEASTHAASAHELYAYAEAFVRCIGTWLSTDGGHAVAAQIFDLKPGDPLRVVRFVLGTESQQRSRPDLIIVRSEGSLNDVLQAIGRRLNFRVAGALVGTRELRVYGADEVIIIKPAGYRHWMGVAALDDADAVIAESFAGAAA